MPKYNVVFTLPPKITVKLDAESDKDLESKGWAIVAPMTIADITRGQKTPVTIMRVVEEFDKVAPLVEEPVAEDMEQHDIPAEHPTPIEPEVLEPEKA